MLRKIRIALAALFFVIVHAWLGWTAKIQFLPALMAMNVAVILALIILTLLFDRIYCSVICPLGIMQDIISWISGRRKKKHFRFNYSPEIKWRRYGILAVFVIAMIAGPGSVVALLAPCRYRAGSVVTLLTVPPCNRCRQVQWMHIVFPQMQGIAEN